MDADQKQVELPSSPKKIFIGGFQPSTTYCLHIVMLDSDDNEIGEPSPELVFDTEAVGCTPKQKSCCVVQ